MPRLGVPSTTDSARAMADVCGEPAPLPRSTKSPALQSTRRHFSRAVQPLDRDLGKGTKGRRLGPSPGAKAARLSGRAMAAVSCPPRRFQAKRKLSIRPPKADPGALPAKSLIPRSFQAEAWKRDGHFGVFAVSVAAQERPKRGRAAQDKFMKRTGPRKSTISDWRSPATKPTRYSRPSTRSPA